MAICELHLSQNNVLQKMAAFMAIVPEKKPGPFPVLYLLHGLGDDHTAWTRRSSLERYCDAYPMIVVMPNGERGWYTDSATQPYNAYETFITQDLIGFVDSAFHTIPTRAGRAVAGLSMGGYGAVKLAVKHPSLFCAGVSHSGAVEAASQKFEEDSDFYKELYGVLGRDFVGGDNDLYALTEQCEPSLRPALRIDCGTEDWLIEQNQRFTAHLQKLGYGHEYAEHPGGHDWAYWDTHIGETLAFTARIFGL